MVIITLSLFFKIFISNTIIFRIKKCRSCTDSILFDQEFQEPPDEFRGVSVCQLDVLRTRLCPGLAVGKHIILMGITPSTNKCFYLLTKSSRKPQHSPVFFAFFYNYWQGTSHCEVVTQNYSNGKHSVNHVHIYFFK